jgi:hypothetical protein
MRIQQIINIEFGLDSGGFVSNRRIKRNNTKQERRIQQINCPIHGIYTGQKKCKKCKEI